MSIQQTNLHYYLSVNKYKNVPKGFSGNLVTPEYYTTTAREKRFNIRIPSLPSVDLLDDAEGAYPAILLPSGLAMEEFIGARFFYDEAIWSDWANGGYTFMPAVSQCHRVEPYAPELPNLYKLISNFMENDPVYDSETGVLLVGESDYIKTLLDKQNLQPEDYTQAFTMIRDVLIGDAPKINAEITDLDQNIHATITFSVPAKEFYNAGCCVATYDIGSGQYVGTDEPIVALMSGGTRVVHFTPVDLWIQNPDDPFVKIKAGSAFIDLVQIDDEGKVYSTETQ